jgi:cytochrome b561
MLAARSTPRYTAVAQALHWLLALGLTAQVVLGLTMTHAGLARMTQFKFYQLHKSIGITILIVALLRLVWRLAHQPPALPDDMPGLEKSAAHSTHVLLYILMIGLPLVGWAMVSVSPFNLPTVLFGVVPWPHMPWLTGIADKPYWEAVAKWVHAYGAYLLIALVLLHAAAALRHHIVLRDDILARMVPGLRRRPLPGEPIR